MARFADDGEKFTEDLEKAETELGSVYLPKKGIKYAPKVTLGFSNFMNKEKITVMGAQPE